MKTNKIVLGLVIVGLLAYIAMNETESFTESFNAFYYGPRRDPSDYKRHPFSFSG